MGHRANLVLVEGGAHRVFYGHWSSKALTAELFFGPDAGRAWVLAHQEVGNAGWLDDVFAEGGALLDFDQRVVLLYGGDDLSTDPFLRQPYLELLRESWAGWDVRWAERGIVDLAEYVGLDPQRVRGDDHSYEHVDLAEPWFDTWTVASFRFEDGRLVHFPLTKLPADLVGAGVRLVALAQEGGGVDRLDLPAGTELGGGLMVDVPARRVSVWLGQDLPRLQEHRAAWAPYELVLLGDRWEPHFAAAGGTLSFVFPTEDQVLATLRASILAGVGDGGASSLRRVVQEREQLGHDVQVNPAALTGAPAGPGADHRTRWFDEVVARWRARTGH